jgi:hypothetical protein
MLVRGRLTRGQQRHLNDGHSSRMVLPTVVPLINHKNLYPYQLCTSLICDATQQKQHSMHWLWHIFLRI